jgi:hypothetical protein
MDRISTLRNIEDALARYEDGELQLPELEREVRGVLRTYATDFEDATAYRARGNPSADGLVVVADSRASAREQIEGLVDAAAFEVEPVE